MVVKVMVVVVVVVMGLEESAGREVASMHVAETLPTKNDSYFKRKPRRAVFVVHNHYDAV